MQVDSMRMDIPHTVDLLGGIATRQQLIAAGCSGYDITIAVRRGVITRIRQARYATSSASADAVAATRVGGMLAGPSAARSYGLWSGFDTRLHVSVGRNSSRLRTNVAPSFRRPSRPLTPDTSPRRIVVHWLAGGAVPELGPECWRVAPDTCLRQMVSWSDRETAVACLDTALTVFNLDRVRIQRMFMTASAAERVLASRCRRGSDSGTESLVRQRLTAMGIAHRQQVAIPGVGRVDFALRGTRIVIEVDSRAYHSDPVSFERDRWRDGELVARGFTVIRLSYERATSDWPWCRRVILAALAAAPR